MALDTKTIKEELPDKDAMYEINANRRLKGGGSGGEYESRVE